MKKIFIYILVLFGSLEIASCVYPFTTEGVEEELGLLVMEGDINAGVISSFTPSRSISLTDKGGVMAVELSDIYIESEGGERFALMEKVVASDKNFINNTKLSYVVDTRGLDGNSRCRLVFEADQKRYMTRWLDFVPTPPIDSVTYSIAEDFSHLEIYVHAKGVNDSLRYFKWDYKEDWEISTYFKKEVYYCPDSNQIYNYEDDLSPYYYCWNSSASTDINVFSTESLSENIISYHPIRTIYNDDRRISDLYSIEVHQKALSQEAYKYWETLLKNNDGSAGIFAPQPNEMRGNLYCESDADEMVLGYISCCTVEVKRLFIDRRDHKIYRGDDNCMQEAKPIELWSTMYQSGWDVAYVDKLSGEVMWSPRKCVDCRVFGHKEKPDFWPNDHK